MLFVNSRYLLLTYAQSNGLDEWDVSNHLSALGAECIIAREDHADGGTHLHCFVDFNRKFRSRNIRIFDVGGFHPNVSPSRGTPEKGYDYAIKDGEVVAGGLARPAPRGGMHVGAHRVSNVSHLCESAEEFLELYDEMERGDLIARFSNVRTYADWRFKREVEEYSTPVEFEFASGELDGRDDWVRQSGIRSGEPLIGPRRKSLVLYGRSLTGKTTWARSLGSHIYSERRLNAQMADDMEHTAHYHVIDDVDLRYFPAWKSWLGGMQWISNELKYRNVRLLKWGRPCIWCNNTDPRDVMRRSMALRNGEGDGNFSHEDLLWIEANCIFINIDEEIATFRANTE
nr:MAG: replication-associated protein [Gemycircularvirus]